MENALNKIPALPQGGEAPYDCNNGVWLFLFREKAKEDMDSYVADAVNMGYSVFDETSFGENYYTTLIKDGFCLHIYFTACDSSLRIIADGFTDLYETKMPQVEEMCKTTIWQFEVDHTLIDCGMCYIIRCCDNSFFVIDSAHPYSINDDERIYNFLRKLTPAGEKIRVAGWFFSHAHEDHVGKFCDILRYKTDIEIEALYYNFISTEHRDSHNWMPSNKNFQRMYEQLFEEHTEIKKIKLHSGQHFFVRNLEFRVLCTHEDVYPNSNLNYNDSSTMLIMNACGNTVQFPGDAGFEESDIVCPRFGKLLKCDIMQAAHHGHFGTRTEFYELSDAKTILFPTTQIKYDEEFEKIETNRIAVAIAEECFIASNGTMEFNLPYKVGEAIHHDDETFEDFDGVYNLWSYTYTEERKQELRDLFIKNGGKF